MKSGCVAIIGRPNVGKSTLLNYLVGEKLAGISSKPQTTRIPVRGILTRPEGQIVFLDTPGLHDPRDPLGEWMMGEARKALDDTDLIYWMILPVTMRQDEKKILGLLAGCSKPVILVMNQIDRFPKMQMLPVLDEYQKAYSFKEMIPVSAKTGEQVGLLVQKTFAALPEGPLLFPEDQISDQNERFIAREMILEKLFRFTGEEIPYSSTVLIEDFKEKSDRLVSIQATVIVERDSQKAIVIGDGGQKIKQIGQAARLDLEKFLGKKVFLELWVKVIPKWKSDASLLGRLGYE